MQSLRRSPAYLESTDRKPFALSPLGPQRGPPPPFLSPLAQSVEKQLFNHSDERGSEGEPGFELEPHMIGVSQQSVDAPRQPGDVGRSLDEGKTEPVT